MTALIAAERPLAITEPVVMEACRARSDQREADLRRLLLRFHLLRFDATADFDAATRIYRRCRNAGISPRGMIDCMIAAAAWRRGASVLTQDANLAQGSASRRNRSRRGSRLRITTGVPVVFAPTR